MKPTILTKNDRDFLEDKPLIDEFRIEQEDLLDTIKYINAGATSVSKEDGSGQ